MALISNTNKFFFILLIGLFVFAFQVYAINPFDIEYPIPELGNCASQRECKTYCDDSANQDTCLSFAERIGMISHEEAERARSFQKQEKEIEKGPGGCTSRSECDNFCRDERNLNECLNYSVEHGYTTQEEAERIREQANRGGPGGCNSRESCDAFCRNPSNANTCLSFVVGEGIITQEEADFMIQQMERYHRGQGPRRSGGPGPNEHEDIDKEKVLKLLKEMDGPGGCSTMGECETFCGNPDNDDECMAFAIEHGLIPPDKVEMIKKMKNLAGPGGCKGRDECDTYCSQPSHGEECMNFAIENGLMSPEELEMMKRGREIMMKLDSMNGPGNCQGREECSIYCSDESHMEECMQFSVDHGMVDKGRAEEMMHRGEDARRRIDKEKGRFMGENGEDDHNSAGIRDFINFTPPQVLECIKSKVGGNLDALVRQQTDEFRHIMNGCYQEFNSREFENNDNSQFDGFEGDNFDGSHGESFPPPQGYQNYPPPENYGPAEGYENYPSPENYEPSLEPRSFPSPSNFAPEQGASLLMFIINRTL